MQNLDISDHLTFQLYTVSKNPETKKKKIRGWIGMTITFFCLSYLSYTYNDATLSIYFLFVAIVFLFFYPFYWKWRYKRHYLKHVSELYKNNTGEASTITFEKDFISTTDNFGEIKLKVSEIEEINEIKNYYFIKSRNGLSLIISKVKSESLKEIQERIKSLTESGIKHNVDLNWNW
jgi:hypothetical protein